MLQSVGTVAQEWAVAQSKPLLDTFKHRILKIIQLYRRAEADGSSLLNAVRCQLDAERGETITPQEKKSSGLWWSFPTLHAAIRNCIPDTADTATAQREPSRSQCCKESCARAPCCTHNMTSECHRHQTSSAPTGTLQVQGRGALGLGCWRSNLSSMVSSIYLRRLLWDHKALISIIAQSTRCSYQGSGTPLKGRMAWISDRVAGTTPSVMVTVQ